MHRTHHVVADSVRAQELASTISPFRITIRFHGGLTPSQEAAFDQAAFRWTRVIVGDLPSMVLDGEVVDDILIHAQGIRLDGPGRVLGQAGPTRFRPMAAGPAGGLPYEGIMQFDADDLMMMEIMGTLVDVITHEMGHALGIGTIWAPKGLLADPHTLNPTFTGWSAKAEYGALRQGGPDLPVPVENVGGAGSVNSHWREAVFPRELMSSVIASRGNPLSRLTVASLQDLGYQVDLNAAEPYALGLMPAVSATDADSFTCRLVGALARPLAAPSVPPMLAGV